MTAIEIDSSNSRLWLVRFPTIWNGADYELMTSEFIARNPTGVRFAVIIDMRLSGESGTSPEDRTSAHAVMKEHAEWARKATVCSVRVTTNTILRAALTVYDWDTAAPWPRKTFVSGQVAEAWARDRLAADGIECAPEPVWRP